MENNTGRKGSKVVKLIGFVAVVGILIAVGRIVYRVFSEKSGAGESHEGV
jgi:hypothetical protein